MATEKIQDRLRALRVRANLTQEQIAERSGPAKLRRTEINALEASGKGWGSWRMREGVARALSLDVSELSRAIDGVIPIEQLSFSGGRSPAARRALAAELALEAGVAETAVNVAISRPIAATEETWSTLRWADEIRIAAATMVRDVAP